MTKVIKRFRDRATGVIYEVTGKYEGDAERIAELQEKGYLEKDKPVKKAKKKSKPKESE